MGLKIYDLTTDGLRNVRKADIDHSARVEAAFGVYFTGAEKLKLLVQGIVKGEITPTEAHERLHSLDLMPRPKE